MIKAVSLFLLIFLFSCNGNKRYIEKKENGGDEVYTVSGEDDEMNTAIEKAVKSYTGFLKVYKLQDTSCSYFSVKMRFVYKEAVEHMWLNQLYFKNERLYGILDSDPIDIFTAKAGDSLEIQEDKVSDWMYLKNGKLVGGYTIKVLYNKMNKKEREEFKNELGFDID